MDTEEMNLQKYIATNIYRVDDSKILKFIKNVIDAFLKIGINEHE